LIRVRAHHKLRRLPLQLLLHNLRPRHLLLHRVDQKRLLVNAMTLFRYHAFAKQLVRTW
jgi:hypothetical protein